MDRLTILPGQRLLVDGQWRTEGETVEVSDPYRAAVLVHSDVAVPAADAPAKTRKRASRAK